MTGSRGWDGHSPFYEDDESADAVAAMWAAPIDTVTGAPFDPDAVAAIQQRDAAEEGSADE